MVLYATSVYQWADRSEKRNQGNGYKQVERYDML